MSRGAHHRTQTGTNDTNTNTTAPFVLNSAGCGACQRTSTIRPHERADAVRACTHTNSYPKPAPAPEEVSCHWVLLQRVWCVKRGSGRGRNRKTTSRRRHLWWICSLHTLLFIGQSNPTTVILHRLLGFAHHQAHCSTQSQHSQHFFAFLVFLGIKFTVFSTNQSNGKSSSRCMPYRQRSRPESTARATLHSTGRHRVYRW